MASPPKSFILGDEAGNVIFYILLAVGLLAMLTYALVNGSRENYATQGSVSVAEDLFSQSNTIRSAIQQCAMEFPEGGVGTCGGFSCADLNQDGGIDTSDNPNLPYPIAPSSALNANAIAGCTTTGNAVGCTAAAANDYVRNVTCVGAPLGQNNIFQGINNSGRFLPPPPSGFSEWVYHNDSHGVYIQITGPGDAGSLNAINRVMSKFETCQADINYNSCGSQCLTVWVLRSTCP